MEDHVNRRIDGGLSLIIHGNDLRDFFLNDDYFFEHSRRIKTLVQIFFCSDRPNAAAIISAHTDFMYRWDKMLLAFQVGQVLRDQKRGCRNFLLLIKLLLGDFVLDGS